LCAVTAALLLSPLAAAALPGATAAPTPLYRASAWTSPIFINISASAGVSANASILDPEAAIKERSDGFLNGGRGACFVDIDGDGDDDIYVSGPGKDQLFRNDGNMSFTDITDAAGLGDMGYGMACASGDLDNDGDADLIVTNYKSYMGIWRNNGDSTFTNITNISGIDDTGPHTGIALADFNGDGLVDIFLAEYQKFNDRIYKNLGNLTFKDMTATSWITDYDYGFQPVVADYNGDGLPDIYVANDFGPDTLWKNDGNFTFADVSLISGAYDPRGGMGASWVDFNSDGDPDLFVTNYGQDGLWDNRGGAFYDVANQSGVDDPWTGWGTAWIDFDLDGDLDLVVVNGNVDGQLEWQQPDKLFRNDGNGTFTDVSENSGADSVEVGRGLAVGDLDGDGRVDMYVLNNNCPALLLHNQLPTTNSYLRVRLQGTVSNRDGIGAEVEVVAGASKEYQNLAAGSSYLSSNSKTLVFGLGDQTTASDVLVKWPSGLKQSLRNVAANQTITIVENDTEDPVARAPDLTVDQGTPFTMNGSGSTDNTRVANWTWSVDVNGTARAAFGVSPVMTIYTPGSYAGRLDVRDIFGRNGSTTYTVTVRPLARVTLDAGPDLVVPEGTLVNFRALGASTVTPDFAGACSFLWNFTDFSGPQTLVGPTPAYLFDHPGFYQLRVSVADPQGATAQDTVNVTVRDAFSPVLGATVPSAVDEDMPVLLDATATTDNDPTFDTTGAFGWSYEGYAGRVNWSGARVLVQFPDPGTFVISLRARDVTGNAAMMNFTIRVRDVTAPLPNAGPDRSVLPGQEMVLDASLSTDNDPNFRALGTFAWSVQVGGGVLNYSGAQASVTFADPGIYRVLLDAWDPSGNRAGAPDIMYVRVLDDQKPVPVAGADRSVRVGVPVGFDGSLSRDNDPALETTGSFLWEFQDGAERHALRGPLAQYTFVRTGVYSVRLTVADQSGNSAAVVFKVTVFDDEAPVISVEPLPSQLTSGSALVLNASSSSDNVGVATYLWKVRGPLGFDGQVVGATGEIVLTVVGDYIVNLTVKDGAGNAVWQEFSVAVLARSTAPGPSEGPGPSPGPSGNPAPSPAPGTTQGDAASAARTFELGAAVLGAAAGALLVGMALWRRRKE
jgi:enediyne biosynthesis protein E4